jgi:inorganic pyrophosphatase
MDLPRSQIDELRHFYATYKIQEGGHTEIKEFRELGDAYQTINRCIEDYNQSFK